MLRLRGKRLERKMLYVISARLASREGEPASKLPRWYQMWMRQKQKTYPRPRARMRLNDR